MRDISFRCAIKIKKGIGGLFMKKKSTAFILAAAMVLGSMTGCGSSNANVEGESSDTAAVEDTENADESSELTKESLETVYEAMGTEDVFITLDDLEAVSAEEDLTIGLAMGYGLSTPFYTALAEAFTEEAESLGVTVLQADCESDPQTQVSKLENFIAQDVDGIVVLPTDPNTSITLVLEKAYEQGIPVITVDVPPADDATYYATFITDAYSLGYSVGEEIAKQLLEMYPEGEIEYGIIGGVEGNPTPTARNEGMRDGVASVDTEGRIVETAFLYANAFSEESGLDTAENMLIAHPDLKAILGTCDAHVVGATSAAKRQGLDDQIIMGGVDGSIAAMEIMKEGGPIKVLALNSPNDVGRSAARAMVAFLSEGTVVPSKRMIIEGGVVTPDNVDEYMDLAF